MLYEIRNTRFTRQEILCSPPACSRDAHHRGHTHKRTHTTADAHNRYDAHNRHDAHNRRDARAQVTQTTGIRAGGRKHDNAQGGRYALTHHTPHTTHHTQRTPAHETQEERKGRVSKGPGNMAPRAAALGLLALRSTPCFQHTRTSTGHCSSIGWSLLRHTSVSVHNWHSVLCSTLASTHLQCAVPSTRQRTACLVPKTALAS